MLQTKKYNYGVHFVKFKNCHTNILNTAQESYCSKICCLNNFDFSFAQLKYKWTALKIWKITCCENCMNGLEYLILTSTNQFISCKFDTWANWTTITFFQTQHTNQEKIYVNDQYLVLIKKFNITHKHQIKCMCS